MSTNVISLTSMNVFRKLLFLFVMLPCFSNAQIFGDKAYFLVDSVNINQMTETDKELLNKALTEYHKSSHDTARISALQIVTENLMDDAWVQYNLLVKQLSEQNLIKNPSLELKKIYLKALAGSLNNIGVNQEQYGNIEGAVINFHKSLKIQETLNDKSGAATTLNNIGAIYNTQNNYEKALEYLNKGLEIRREINDKHGVAQSLNNIGTVHYVLEDHSKALNLYEESLNYYKAINDRLGEAYVLSNMGNIYDILNSNKGLICHRKSLKIRIEFGDKQGEAHGLTNLGESYLKNGFVNEALDYGSEALALSKEKGYPENIKNSSLLLSKIQKEKGDYESALSYYETFVAMHDSIKNEESKKASYKQQTKYEFEKEQAVRDAEHLKEMEIIAEKEQNQKIISTIIAVGLVLLLLFFMFILNRLKLTKKQKFIIEEQKKIVDDKNQEITDSITYAKRIQEAILPSREKLQESLKDGFVLYKPKDIVAGDFYWLEEIEKGKKVMFAVADCTGHGVPGAMVSVVCNNALNRAVREYQLTSPASILEKTKELVIQQFEKSNNDVKDGMDISLCLLDFENRKLTYAGANNPLWLYKSNVSEIIEVKGTKQPIGKTYKDLPFEEHELELENDDIIYLFSDGYPDQFGGPKGKKLKYKPFREFVTSIVKNKMNDQSNILNEFYENWMGEIEQIDDVCVVGVKV